MPESNKCNGIVASKIMRIALIEYGHADGRICARPGPSYLAIGDLVESEWLIDGPLCEHVITKVHGMATEPKEKSPTVADILQAHSTASDEPVSQDVIQRAKIPPPIRRDPSTVPARAADAPIEQRYEFDPSEDEIPKSIPLEVFLMSRAQDGLCLRSPVISIRRARRNSPRE